MKTKMTNAAIHWMKMTLDLSGDFMIEKCKGEPERTKDLLENLFKKLQISSSESELVSIEFTKSEYLALLMLAKMSSEMVLMGKEDYLKNTLVGEVISETFDNGESPNCGYDKLALMLSCWADFLESFADKETKEDWDKIKFSMCRDRMQRFFDEVAGGDFA